jgi:hypothetical protein
MKVNPHPPARNSVCAISCLFALALSLVSAHCETLTYADLLHRLTDLDHLATLPPDGEKTALASSYDRASSYDAAADKYANWGANADNNGIVRQEGDTSVFAEITGPGCIDRIWSAQPESGHVRIYLDGSATPAVDLPFADYFSGKAAPFTRPNLVYLTGNLGGWNNYTPIPFQKSCKIVADKNWGAYYQFTYTQFAPGTTVPTFTTNLSPADTAALDQANAILGRCGENPVASRPGETTETLVSTLDPGQTSVVDDLKGPQVITGLSVKVGLPKDAEEQRRFLRQLALQITWDDDAEPAIWAPLGDFFGFVGGAAPYKTLPVGYTGDGWFYCYWYMPFASRAHIEILNEGDHPAALNWKISHAPLPDAQPIANLTRLHVKWHRDAFRPSRDDRFPDWTLLTTQGRGRYVGTHLHVYDSFSGWWGEGDEKFFIDGEKFPSTFGTGSEDYFGYAWCRPEFFSRPYHSQPLNTNNTGHVDDNRWHISDNLPFQKSFEGCIEKYWDETRTRYAAAVFWYLAPGGADPYLPQQVATRTDYWNTAIIVPEVIKGRDMTVLGKPKHDVVLEQYVSGSLPRMWANDTEVMWPANSVGEHIDLQFPVKTTGTYRIMIRPTLMSVAGIAQLSIDGKNVGAPLDFYIRNLTVGDAVSLDILKLDAGTHTLGITTTGKNPASEHYNIAFDWLELRPQKP